MSHAAVLSVCQMPLKSGLPSGVRGIWLPVAAGRAAAAGGRWAGAAWPPASVNAVATTMPAPVTRAILPGDLIGPSLEPEDVVHLVAAFVARELGRQLFVLVVRVQVPGDLHRPGERLRILVRHHEGDQLVR